MSNLASDLNQAAKAAFLGMPSSLPDAVNIRVPTAEQPFGLALWPIFRYCTYALTSYDVESFKYEYNSTVPLSRIPHVLFAILSYYIVIFGGRWALKGVRPIKFGFIFKLHNLLLHILSGALLVLLVEQIFPIIAQNGVFFSICSEQAWTQKIELIYYLNYLTKYYELIDTIFMVFRKRPLTFLHTYHHGATALLCFSQLNGRTSVSYVPISLNLAVHVVMYFYYFLSACGIRPWWKTWVTRFQIIQFVIDLGFVYFATYTHFVSRLGLNLPNMGTCAGEESAAIDGCLILSSYLVLFISFYIKSYIVAPAARKAAREQQMAEAAAEGTNAKEVTKAALNSAAPASASPRKRTTRSRKA